MHGHIQHEIARLVDRSAQVRGTNKFQSVGRQRSGRALSRRRARGTDALQPLERDVFATGQLDQVLLAVNDRECAVLSRRGGAFFSPWLLHDRGEVRRGSTYLVPLANVARQEPGPKGVGISVKSRAQTRSRPARGGGGDASCPGTHQPSSVSASLVRSARLSTRRVANAGVSVHRSKTKFPDLERLRLEVRAHEREREREIK